MVLKGSKMKWKLARYVEAEDAGRCEYCGHPKSDPDYNFCSWECSEAYAAEHKED